MNTKKTIGALTTTERNEQIKTAFIEHIRANRTDPNFKDLYTDILYQDAERAVYIALRARHEKSPTEFLTALQNAQANDRQARNNTQIAEQLTALEELHKSHRQGYEFFNSRAHRLTLTDYERALAYTLAQDLKTKADNEQSQINDLHIALELTYSERADLVQTAIMQELENQATPQPIPPHILASYGATDPSELNEQDHTQAQATANSKAIFRAIGQEMTNKQSLNTHTATRTDILNQLPPEVVAQFGQNIIMYNNDTFYFKPSENDPRQGTYRHDLKQGQYFTFEYKEYKEPKPNQEPRKKYRPSGWYLVKHRLTVRNVSRIEEYTTEDGEQIDITALMPNFSEFALDDDLTALEKLISKAELTPRQRTFCTAFLSETAQELADRNRIKYYDKCDLLGTEPTHKGGIIAEYNARISYGLSLAEVTNTKEARKKFMQRLKKALKTAQK